MPSDLLDQTRARLGWSDLPEDLRRGVEDRLGEPVVRTTSYARGFSLGAALRIVTRSGRVAVVKAVTPTVGPESADLLAREGAILRLLSGSPHAPRLLGQTAAGDAQALVLDEVPGVHPGEPWTRAHLHLVGRACAVLQSRGRAEGALDDLPSLADVLEPALGGWRRIRDQGVALDGWAGKHLDGLVALEPGWRDAVAGDALLHADLRADNVLVHKQGAVLIDWPWASRGAPWFDLVLLAAEPVHAGVISPGDVLDLCRHLNLRPPSKDELRVTLVAVLGYYIDASLREPNPRILDPRPHHRSRVAALLPWAQAVTGWTPR